MANKREKEIDRDASDSKKHRKTNANNSTETQSTKVIKTDVYAV